MKSLFLPILIALGCALPLRGFAQPKCEIDLNDIFPDRAGKVVAFKVIYEGVPDTVYFVDIASGAITERIAEGTFGLEFKMMKAKVLKREAEEFSGTSTEISERYSSKKMEKFYRYDVLMKGSLLARAWIPYTFSQYNDELRPVCKANPKTVLLYGRLDGKKALFNMLDTLKDGKARLLYLDKDNKHASSFRWHAYISPDGRYVLAATEAAMIDLEKGKVIWDYPYEEANGKFYTAFSEDGTRVAIERGNYAISVRDMQTGKELYLISTPPAHLASLAGMDCIIPLPDMQHALVYDQNHNSGRINLLLVKADGSYKELRF